MVSAMRILLAGLVLLILLPGRVLADEATPCGD